MLTNENIIVFSSQDWKTPRPTAPKHISIILAEENNVLYIETFGSRLPMLEREHMGRIGFRLVNWLRSIKKLNIKNGQLYIYSPLIPPINFKPFLFINKLLFLSTLKRLIRKLHMQNPILYFYIPPPLGFIEEFPKKATVYHCIDEWLTYPAGENKIFMDSERSLIENADLVLTTNDLLYEHKKPYARRIHKIYHGVDFDHFNREFSREEPLPEDIKNIPRPIMAIVGSFADWMDIDLIKLIAHRHTEWSIVSIGQVESNVDISGLMHIDNVYFLGPKDYSALPNYCRAIDVFIIPFLLNEHIKYCAPTRLYEHLSSGKPIITTDFPAAREVEEDLISIALTRDDFVKKIDMALKENDLLLIEKRKTSAKKNTWKSRVEEISKIIKEIINEK